MRPPTDSQPEEHNVHPVYRPDIDGLRAVAILSVVAFHAFPRWLPGGFVGVDVFFVISGFLISTIIFRSLQRGDFSFTEFYAHRIKRIFPALIVVLTACYAFGWFALLPDEFKQLGKHMAAGAGFVQNFILWQEVGYFDTAAELKPLLHLWSLAIEEQFYLIYPVLIFVVWRLGLNVLTVVLLLALISFGLNISGVSANPTETFFMPQTRFWELLAGSVLAYLQFFKRAKLASWMQRWFFHPVLFRHPPNSVRRGEVLNSVLSVAGLLLLVAAVWLINKSKPFPGYWAVLPVSGAFLLILAGPDAWGNRFVLANRLMVFVGLISYPLYLWHWPILSFARIIEGEMPSREIRIGAVVLSFVLAWLTYRLIEKPIRFGKKTWIKVAVLSVALVLVACIGYGVFKNNGIEYRFKHLRPVLSQLGWNGDQQDEVCMNRFSDGKSVEFCRLAKQTDPTILLVGDSTSWQLYFGLAAETANSPENVLAFNQGGCAPFLGLSTRFDYEMCHFVSLKSYGMALNSESIKTVVLSNVPRYFGHTAKKIDIHSKSSSFDNFKSEAEYDAWTSLVFHDFLERLLKTNKKVIFVRHNPQLTFDLKTCLSTRPLKAAERLICAQPRSVSENSEKNYRAWIDKLIKDFPDIKVVDLADALCDETNCWAMKNGKMLYRDVGHLSRDGSSYVAKKLIEVVD